MLATAPLTTALMTTLLAGGSAHAQTCATPAVLDALAGRRPAPHEHALVPPDHLNGVARSAPPGSAPPGAKTGKVVYGTPYEDHLDTDNFTINWWQSGITKEQAAAAADALETAWASYVDAGWTPPVSSDRYLLWVLLDPSLGSTTGYTTEYFSADYPDGYPVIYLNPDHASPPSFWSALSAHELMHAFEYALRDYDKAGEIETWYWEASATWASELADPTVDGHQYTSEWYATTADLTYTSSVSTRQYGLFVLNAWLDVEGFGPDTMRQVWELSADQPGVSWDVLISDATDMNIGTLWARFTGAYANRQLAESDLYTDIPSMGLVSEEAMGTLPYLGTQVWDVDADGVVTADGDVLLAQGIDSGPSVTVQAGQRLSVTGVAQSDAAYVLFFDGVEQDSDSGDSDSGDSDSADGGSSPSGTPRDSSGGACGCAGAPARSLLTVLLFPCLALARRRSR